MTTYFGMGPEDEKFFPTLFIHYRYFKGCIVIYMQTFLAVDFGRGGFW